MEDASNEAKTSSARREQTNAASNPPALIVCGPSGVGKGTLLQLLQKEMGNKVALLPTLTRAMPGTDLAHVCRLGSVCRTRRGRRGQVRFLTALRNQRKTCIWQTTSLSAIRSSDRSL